MDGVSLNSLAQEYREAVASDIPEIVKIHQAAFPEFFMTLLGPRFLEHYYRLVIAYPARIFWVKQGRGGLEGFVSGFLNPAQFYTEMRRYRWGLFSSLLARICIRPSLVPRLFASYEQTRHTIQGEDSSVCELSSIAVPPGYAGRGIGKGLMHVFIEDTRGKATSIMLTTDAEGNNAVNAFYQGLGFKIEGSFERSKGRHLNKYSFSLERES